MMRVRNSLLPGWLLLLVLTAALAGCRSPESGLEVPEPAPRPMAEQPGEPEPGELQLQAWEIEFRRQRVIGDLLYDALHAMAEDRLLYPANDNAYNRYRRVLALDPDNRLAREGLQNIVARYLELAATASRQGRFDAAGTYIQRARAVDRDDPAIAAAESALAEDRNSGDPVYELDLRELEEQSQALVDQLAEIAEQAVARRAFVWITAPSDEIGRWIYSTMREQADGFRLRGNIELGARALIRLRLPDDSAQVSLEHQPVMTTPRTSG